MVNLSNVLSNMVKAIVDDADAVAVTTSESANGDMVLEVTVAPDDMGKVIGKHGRIARAIRMMMKAAASSVDRKVVVKIK